MKRFRFQLQALLDQRRRTEEQHQLRVATLDRERLTVEERLRDLQDRIHASKAELRMQLVGGQESGPGTVSAADVRLQAAAALQLAAQARLAALELAGAYRRVERARVELLEAARAHKAVQLLRERRLMEWRAEAGRRESAAGDEAAMNMFNRETADGAGGGGWGVELGIGET